MAYILDGFMIDYFERDDRSLSLKVRASVDEFNGTMRRLYGPNRCIDIDMNFQAFEFENATVQYIQNGYLSVKVLSPRNKEIDRLEGLIREV